jgi:Arc/MetJ family transcription regulator
MRICIKIDDELMAKAKAINPRKTKRVIIDEALRLFVTLENQKKLSEFWGRIDIEEYSQNV